MGSHEAMREAVRGSVPAGTEELNLKAFDAGASYYDDVIVARHALEQSG